MEASDDIAYGLSDICDGIEKGILNLSEVIKDIRTEWIKAGYNEQEIEVLFPTIDTSSGKVYRFDTFEKYVQQWVRLIIDEVSNVYVNKHELFAEGSVPHLIREEGIQRILEVIKSVSRKKLYRSREAESIELSGYSIICGILEHYGALLQLNRAAFSSLLDMENLPFGKGLDLEIRLCNSISKRLKNAYLLQLQEFLENKPFKHLGEADIEWWLRVHLIIDQVAGMTDMNAVETFRTLHGC